MRPWRLLLGLFLALVVLGLVGQMAWTQLAGPAAVDHGLQAARPWFLAWRVLFYTAIVLCWNPVVERIAQHQGWESDHTAFVQGLRWRVAIWLIIFELVLVQNIVGRFLGGLLT